MNRTKLKLLLEDATFVLDCHRTGVSYQEVDYKVLCEGVVIKTLDLVQELGAANSDNPDVSWTCSTLIKIIEQYWGMCEPA